MRKRLLRLLAFAAFRAPWLCLAAAIVLTLLSAHLAIHGLSFQTDVTFFLPGNLPEVRDYNAVRSEFGSFHYLIAVFESEASGREDDLRDLADQFAGAIRRPDLVASVEYKVDTTANFYENEQRVVNLMTERDWAAIEERLEPEAIERMVKRLVVLLQAPEPNRPRESLLEDPFDVRAIIRERLRHTGGPIDIPLREGYILSKDGRMLLMIIRPQKSATDPQFSHRLMTFLRRARMGISARNAAIWRDAKVDLRFIGAHVETDMSTNAVARDLAATSIVSLVGVVLLFLLAFRRPTALAMVALPVVLGVVWTLGLTALIYGHLNMVTIAIASVMVGLGIDFGVHVYNRFVEEIRRGVALRKALDRALVNTGEGILTAAMTTAVAFFGLVLTTSPGFKELGVIGGVGVLCSLLAVYLTLPSLMIVNARMWLGRERPASLASFGLDRVATVIFGYPRATIVVGVALTAYFAYHAREVKFSQDWSVVEYQSEPYDRFARFVDWKFDGNLPGPEIAAVVSAPTFQGALEANDQLYENLEAARGETFPALLSYDSLRVSLPSIKTQEASRRRIVASLDQGAVKERIESIGRRYGLAEKAFASFIDYLRRLEEVHAVDAPYSRFLSQNAPPILRRLVQRYATKTSLFDRDGAVAPGAGREQYHIITHIYPRKGGWRHGPPPAFFDLVSSGTKNIRFAGDNLLLSAGINEDLFSNLARSIVVVALAVLLLLLLHFRNFRLAIFAMLPVGCCLIWMLGFMRLVDMDLNVLNVVVLPLIIGIGIDDGIHVLQRFFEAGADPADPERGDIEAAVRHTGRAVVVTSLTTIIGFGALSLAHYQGLRQIGLLSILGIGFALVTTLTLLPTLLYLTGPRLKLLNVVGRDKGVDREPSQD